MRLAVVIAVVGLLLASPLHAGRCPKACKRLFGTQLKTCQKACPKSGPEARTCRSGCRQQRTGAKRTCKASVNPTAPNCGLPPVVTPTTTTTTSTSSTITTTTSTTVTSTTTTTICIPRSCAQAGAECGTIDDGCGGTTGCGGCPPFDTPICVGNSCQAACDVAEEGIPCDSDANACTDEVCSDGSCTLRGTPTCSPPGCWVAAACNPMSGGCELSGYLGDGVPCDGFGGPGVCADGFCHSGNDCAVNAVPYAAGDRTPGGTCRACVPEVSRTVGTPVGDGLPCTGGFCQHGACSADICSIGGQIVAAGVFAASDPCRACQPAVDGTQFSPVTDGTPCAGGVCVAGTCEALSCVIDGTKYSNGALNPGNPCQACDVATSRTSWTTRPNNTTCGGGCASGFCNFGTCQFFGSFPCAASECAFGSCNVTTGNCEQFPNPAKIGLSCTVVSANPCLAAQGTCDASGQCVAPSVVGRSCSRASDPCRESEGTCNDQAQCVTAPKPGETCIPAGNQGECRTTAAGTCDPAGNCLGNPLPEGSPCTRPPPGWALGDHPCGNYACRSGACDVSPDERGHAPELCLPPILGAVCPTGRCSPLTLTCDYTAPPNGVRRCEQDGECCGGQKCQFPVSCGAFCFGKFCYYPGTNVK